MKASLNFAILSAVSTVFCLGAALGSFLADNSIEAKEQQAVFPQSCNPGTMIRPNGSIMLDAWNSFESPVDGKVKFPNKGVPQPTTVHFGYTLPNELKVCFEWEEADGSACVPLFKLRTLAFDKPPSVGMPGDDRKLDKTKPKK